MASLPTAAPSLLLILDVDGVTRKSITDVADPRVLDRVEAVLEAYSKDTSATAHVAFVSGTQALASKFSASAPATPLTPSTGDTAVTASDAWRNANVPLCDVFGTRFISQLANGTLSISGQLGVDRLRWDSSLKTFQSDLLVGFTTAEVGSCLNTLIGYYLQAAKEVFPSHAAAAMQMLAEAVDKCCNETSTTAFCRATPDAFRPFVQYWREHCDPNFRVIVNGATIELHDYAVRRPGVEDVLGKLQSWIATNAEQQGNADADSRRVVGGNFTVSGGDAHSEHGEFRFLAFIRSNKGEAVDWLLETTAEMFGGSSEPPHVVTIGDTRIDYPMHVKANLSFHVGKAEVFSQQAAVHGDAVRHVRLVTEDLKILAQGDKETEAQGNGASWTDGTCRALDALLAEEANLFPKA